MGNVESSSGTAAGAYIAGFILAPFTGGASIIIGAAAAATTVPVIVLHAINDNHAEDRDAAFISGVTAGASTVFASSSGKIKTKLNSNINTNTKSISNEIDK